MRDSEHGQSSSGHLAGLLISGMPTRLQPARIVGIPARHIVPRENLVGLYALGFPFRIYTPWPPSSIDRSWRHALP